MPLATGSYNVTSYALEVDSRIAGRRSSVDGVVAKRSADGHLSDVHAVSSYPIFFSG